MISYQKILDELTEGLKESSIGIFITGSVARGEDNKNSDIDVLVLSKNEHSFEEKVIEGKLVEIKTNTIEGFKQKMSQEPMNVYQWLDAKVISDPENLLPEFKNYAQSILDNYTPLPLPKKWLESTLIKIKSAQDSKDDLLLGFHVSNILWKVVESLYTANSLPTPPATTAYKRIKTLKNLPENFGELWSNVLTGELNVRAESTIKLITYLIK